jgi:hypothetical protein
MTQRSILHLSHLTTEYNWIVSTLNVLTVPVPCTRDNDDEMRSCVCGNGPLQSPSPIPQIIHEWICNNGGIILTGETRRTQVSRFSSELSHALSRFSAVNIRRLTAWAMARLYARLSLTQTHPESYLSEHGLGQVNSAIKTQRLTHTSWDGDRRVRNDD